MKGPQRQLRAEFYPKSTRMHLQNSSFEVQGSYKGPFNFYRVSRGPIRKWGRVLFSGHGHRPSVSAQEVQYTMATCLSTQPWWKWANKPQQTFCLLSLETGLLPWKTFSLYPQVQDTHCTIRMILLRLLANLCTWCASGLGLSAISEVSCHSLFRDKV